MLEGHGGERSPAPQSGFHKKEETMTNRYHVQVKIRDGYNNEYVWRRVRPTGGDPYVFTRDEAQAYVKTYSLDHPGMYRLEELPE
jgi:hypothetical protein